MSFCSKMNFLKLTVSLFLAFPALLSASVTIDNISLKKQGDFTEFTVYTSDRVKIEHMIVEPGAGKPYRIVLDLRDAVHKLPHYNFNDLPSETITSIRTSQFSIRPEKVVRVVLDVKGQVTYKVKESGKRVTLIVATPNDKEFSFWCAQPLSEASKIQLALEKDVDSEEPAQEKEQPTSEPTGDKDYEASERQVLVSTAVSDDTDNEPKIPVPSHQTETQTLPDKSSSTPTARDGNEPEVAEQLSLPAFENKNLGTIAMMSLPERVSFDSTELFSDADELQKQVPALKAEGKSKAKIKEEKKVVAEPRIISKNKKTSPVKSTIADSAVKPESVVPKIQREESEKFQDTSLKESKPTTPAPPPAKGRNRPDKEIYRTNPERPTKTTGTLADRFPKRKIVKYRSLGKRDPFSPLIEQSLTGYKSGDIPNIETLRLVGVLRAPEGSSALLEDVEGYGYILKDGDRIQNGYVVQIREDKIIFQVSEYGWSRTVALKLETDD